MTFIHIDRPGIGPGIHQQAKAEEHESQGGGDRHRDERTPIKRRRIVQITQADQTTQDKHGQGKGSGNTFYAPTWPASGQ